MYFFFFFPYFIVNRYGVQGVWSEAGFPGSVCVPRRVNTVSGCEQTEHPGAVPLAGGRRMGRGGGQESGEEASSANSLGACKLNDLNLCIGLLSRMNHV